MLSGSSGKTQNLEVIHCIQHRLQCPYQSLYVLYFLCVSQCLGWVNKLNISPTGTIAFKAKSFSVPVRQLPFLLCLWVLLCPAWRVSRAPPGTNSNQRPMTAALPLVQSAASSAAVLARRLTQNLPPHPRENTSSLSNHLVDFMGW